MKILIVDNVYRDQWQAGAEGLKAINDMMCDLADPEDVEILQGYTAFHNYVSSRNLTNMDILIVMIHESFGLNFFEAKHLNKREAASQVCEEIRAINSRARTVIYGFGLDVPVPYFVDEAKADAVFLGAVPYEVMEEIINRGPVTDDEIKLRGVSAEIVGENRRETGKGITLYIKREREGD